MGEAGGGIIICPVSTMYVISSLALFVLEDGEQDEMLKFAYVSQPSKAT